MLFFAAILSKFHVIKLWVSRGQVNCRQISREMSKVTGMLWIKIVGKGEQKQQKVNLENVIQILLCFKKVTRNCHKLLNLFTFFRVALTIESPLNLITSSSSCQLVTLLTPISPAHRIKIFIPQTDKKICWLCQLKLKGSLVTFNVVCCVTAPPYSSLPRKERKLAKVSFTSINNNNSNTNNKHKWYVC